MSVVLKLHRRSSRVVAVEGPLRVPVNRALRDNVRALLRRGERTITLDLAEVTRIDAAGVGELVRAFNLTAAVNGRLHAFCIHHHPPLADFRDAVPFVAALVELDEGPRMMSFLAGVEPDPAAIRCEMPLAVSFTELEDGHVLPVFRPAIAR